jgi:hypothetical protein
MDECDPWHSDYLAIYALHTGPLYDCFASTSGSTACTVVAVRMAAAGNLIAELTDD